MFVCGEGTKQSGGCRQAGKAGGTVAFSWEGGGIARRRGDTGWTPDSSVDESGLMAWWLA